MGRVGYHEKGGKDFSQQVFDDYSTTFCPCGATYDSQYVRDVVGELTESGAWKKWETEHRSHLDDKRGTMAGALAQAETHAKNLLATDPRFQQAVHIAHTDGSVMFLKRAFTIHWKEFVIVFTEHHGYFTYDKEDLMSYGEYAGLPGGSVAQ